MSVHVLDGLDLTLFFLFEARFRPYLRVLMYARSTVIYADPMKPKLSINFAGDFKKKKKEREKKQWGYLFKVSLVVRKTNGNGDGDGDGDGNE